MAEAAAHDCQTSRSTARSPVCNSIIAQALVQIALGILRPGDIPAPSQLPASAMQDRQRLLQQHACWRCHCRQTVILLIGILGCAVAEIPATQGRSRGGDGSRGGANNNTNAMPEQNLTEWQHQQHQQLQEWEHHFRRQEVPEQQAAAQALAPSPSLVQHECTLPYKLQQQQLAERQTFQRHGINEQPHLQQCQPHQPPAAQPGCQLGPAQGAAMTDTSSGILHVGKPNRIGTLHQLKAAEF